MCDEPLRAVLVLCTKHLPAIAVFLEFGVLCIVKKLLQTVLYIDLVGACW